MTKRAISTMVFCAFMAPGTGAAKNTCAPRVRLLNAPPIEKKSAAVYWDVSKSMKGFGPIMREIISTLDSAILPQAGVNAVTHWAVGSDVNPLPNATAALTPTADWTSLHTAAERAAADIAAQRIGAAIFVSDMILEIPAAERSARKAACAGVPMPSTPNAGALFGRCFAAGLNGVMPPDVFASVFRVPVKGRNIYVLLIGTDIAMTRDIDRLMQTTWSHVKGIGNFAIADSMNAIDATGVSCAWKPESFRALRIANAAGPGECRFRCEDDTAVAVMECTIKTPSNEGWMTAASPSARTIAAALAFSRTTEVRSNGFTFQLKCPQQRKYVTAGTTLTYIWRSSISASISSEPDVRRLFDSLTRAIAAGTPPRSIEVTIQVH